MSSSGINFGPVNASVQGKIIFPYSPPPWYVQYAPEIALAIFLGSLGIAMYLSPKFRKAVIDLLRHLID
ncbi:hypothetical protein [Saccharolobus islandicus]|uniref:hypothetical protein n=1 Tax=Saccharolobus islandicus TaxID=43080 RepID=UPI00035DE58B|nr:hypothetical protein [Sulfolobus islandicus]